MVKKTSPRKSRHDRATLSQYEQDMPSQKASHSCADTCHMTLDDTEDADDLVASAPFITHQGQAAHQPPRTYSLCVTEADRASRLDRFLGDSLREGDLSREKLKHVVRDGGCAINGITCTVPSTKLRPGQVVTLSLAAPQPCVVGEDAPIHIVWRDAHLAVLNKPAGLTVHPCPSCPEGTLVHRMVHHFHELREQEGMRPGIVHRIDKDTSGMLLIALSEGVRLQLSQAFADRTVEKEYLALVHGVPAPEGHIEEPIGRHPTQKIRMAIVRTSAGGRPASSSWRVLHADPEGRFALVAVRIHTGRTHQIRVHMAHLGHPLWGDATYGPPLAPHEQHLAPLARRQMLHAWRLAFTHPVTGERIALVCPPPPDMAALAVALGQRMQRIVVTGSPGCGKSALVAALSQAGLPTWSADAAVARFYGPGGDGWHALRSRYGERFVPDGASPVDKRALLAAMRATPDLRREVEALVHPLVRHDLEQFFSTMAAQGQPAAVAEIPLLFEAGWRPDGELADLAVGVFCPDAERTHRLVALRGWSPDAATAVEGWQWPQADKMRACQLVVDNSGNLEDLHRRAQGLANTLQWLRSKADARLTRTLHRLMQVNG